MSPSYLSVAPGTHSCAKSAPVQIGSDSGLKCRESDKSSAESLALSGWDIVKAYARPRYERVRSVGAMSGLSVDEREDTKGSMASGE